jgi:hypothetical protein
MWCHGLNEHNAPCILLQSVEMPRLTAGDVPLPVISQILQHVPLRQRLSSCALVCSTWAAAAAAATNSINIEILPKQLPALGLWMQQHGKYVQHLQVKQRGLNVFTSEPTNLIQLHLPAHQLMQLTSLQVKGFVPRLQLSVLKKALQSQAAANSSGLAAASGSKGAAAGRGSSRGRGSRRRGRGTRGSRVLQGGSNRCNDSSNTALAALQPLPNLQQLHLLVPMQSTKTILQFSQCASVTQLKLEALGFRDCPVTQEPPDQTRKVSALLSSLTQLQDLSVSHMTVNVHALPALSSSSLTALRLDTTTDTSIWELRPICIPLNPMLPQLAQLRVLHITRNDFNAAVLAGMPHLQELELRGAWLRSNTGAAEDDYADEGGDGYVMPEAVLMTALAKLQHMRHLVVNPTVHLPLRHNPMLSTALMTSSHLTHLQVCYCEHAPWEMSITPHMFPHGRQWQHLQKLHLETGTSKP